MSKTMDKVKQMVGLESDRPATRPPPSQEALKAVREKYAAAGQSQCLTFYDQLSAKEQSDLYVQLSEIDPDQINKIVKSAQDVAQNKKDDLAPLPSDISGSLIDCEPKTKEEWYKEGLKLVSENKCAVIVMAGGQGTRLGSSDPKGCFDIGLPSHKSLFQLQDRASHPCLLQSSQLHIVLKQTSLARRPDSCDVCLLVDAVGHLHSLDIVL